VPRTSRGLRISLPKISCSNIDVRVLHLAVSTDEAVVVLPLGFGTPACSPLNFIVLHKRRHYHESSSESLNLTLSRLITMSNPGSSTIELENKLAEATQLLELSQSQRGGEKRLTEGRRYMVITQDFIDKYGELFPEDEKARVLLQYHELGLCFPVFRWC
jgi:hypothetical protein